MLTQKNNREVLLHEIDILSFICVEMQLYLDTHPYEYDAIAYFDRNNKMLNELRQEYAQKYSPLTLAEADTSEQKWKWATDPMPWEGGC